MKKLSHSQQQAVEHYRGPCLVLAGPGSGKTFTMICRVLHLIEERGEDPASLLVISFSRAAAEELRQRFLAQTPGKRYPVTFATFHACFFHILQQELHYTPQSIIRNEEKREILNILLTDPCNPYREESIRSREELKEREAELLQKISYYKNQGEAMMEQKEKSEFIRIYHAYGEEMKRRKKLDFDDMGLFCLELFCRHPSILAKWQERFQFLLIDEFQDINPIQFQIVQKLAQKHQNLFVVGDDDQAIYGFRGASPRIMLSFRQYYPQTKEILLETNFRCSGRIVEEAGRVIAANRLRYDKRIVAAKSGGEAVIYRRFRERESEYAYIGESIRNQWEKKGTDRREIAVIYRTHYDMAGLAGTLARRGIPFRMKEKCSSIFAHWVAKDLLSYLRFFLEGGRRKDFLPVMNKPLRYLSRNALRDEAVDLRQLKRYYESRPYMRQILTELERHQVRTRGLDTYAAIRYIRGAVGYDDYLEKYVSEQEDRSRESLQELYEIADFVENSAKGTKNLQQFVREIKEYEEMLNKAMEESREGVWLLTMHGCKGLEFDHVFLPDCNAGKIPHKKAVTEEEKEEERRMLYVAMTRARERLEILYLEDKYSIRLHPSPFLPIQRPIWKR